MSEVYVTDHAVLRYLERVVGVDIEAIRGEIRSTVTRAVDLGASSVRIGTTTYRLVDGVVVTIVEKENVRKRRACRERMD